MTDQDHALEFLYRARAELIDERDYARSTINEARVREARLSEDIRSVTQGIDRLTGKPRLVAVDDMAGT